MKRLLVLAAFAFTIWYGYNHLDQFRNRGQNEIVVLNQSSHPLSHLRVEIGDQVVVVEHLGTGERAMRPFHPPTQDATLHMTWDYDGVLAPPSWSGGAVAAGPVLMRHTLTVQDDAGVIWESELIAKK